MQIITKIKKKPQLFVIPLVYIIMVMLNFLTPLIADDIEYMYKTHNFFTILQDEYHQYLTWTGRSVVHIIARIFLLMPKTVFNFVNPLIYLCLTYLIYQISIKDKTQFYILKYLLINILIWLFIPAFGETLLWETGSANYLWGGTIILSFITIYHHYYQNSKELLNNSWLNLIVVTIIGILAGWCNENTSGGAIIIIVGYIILIYKNKQPLKLWMFSGLIGSFLGLFVMVSAPGNKIRSAYFARSSWSFPHKLIDGMAVITKTLTDNSWTLFILIAILLALGIFYQMDNQHILLFFLYTFAGLATIYVLVLSPSGLTWGRSFFGGSLFIIIAAMIEWPDNLTEKWHPAYLTISSLLLISFLFSFISGTIDIFYSYRAIGSRYTYIKRQQQNGNLTPVIGSLDTPNQTSYPAYSSHLSHIKSDSAAPVNIANAKYFKVKTIQSVSQKDWLNIYKNGNSKLMNIWDFKHYVQTISHSKYTVLISAFGPQNVISNSELTTLTKNWPKLDFTSSQNKDINLSAILSPNKTQIETKSQLNELRLTLNNKTINIQSSYTPYKEQQFSHIVINNYDVSRHIPGINIVVLSNNGSILDSVNFSIINNKIITTR